MDLSIDLSTGGPEVVPEGRIWRVPGGVELWYSATVTNWRDERPSAPDAAAGVTLRLPVPRASRFKRASAGDGWVCLYPEPGATPEGDGGQPEVKCTHGTILDGARTTPVEVTVEIDDDYVGTTSAVASVEQPSEPVLPDGNVVWLEFDVWRKADLAFVTHSGPVAAAVGDVVTYRSRIVNRGPSRARSVTLFQHAPPELEFVPAPGCEVDSTYADPRVRCDVASLVPLQGRTWELQYRVVGPVAEPKKIRVLGSVVHGAGAEPYPYDNSAVTETELRPPSADLSVDVTPPDELVAGSNDPAAYRVTVTNNGPDAADTVLTGSVSGAQYASLPNSCTESAGSFECSLGALAVGATVSTDIGVRVPPDHTGDVSFTAEAASDLLDPDGSAITSVTTPVRQVADVAASMTGPESAKVGETVTYVSVATNHGPSEARGLIRLITVVPEAVSLVSYSGPDPTRWTCEPPRSQYPAVFCQAERLAVGESATLTVTFRIEERPEGGAISNETFAFEDTPGGPSDPQPDNDRAGIRTEVAETATTNPTTDTTSNPTTDTTSNPTTDTTTNPTTDTTSNPTSDTTSNPPAPRQPPSGPTTNTTSNPTSDTTSGSQQFRPSTSTSSTSTTVPSTTTTNPNPSAADVVRLAGTDRIDTAVSVSRSHFTEGGAEAAVIVRADEYADALAAAPLAVARRAPLLLTARSSLDDRVIAELRRVLHPGATVFLVGGPTALSPGVAAAIEANGFHPSRLEGADRFETAVRVAEAVNPEVLLLATGTNFADALAAGAAAGVSRGAVVLTSGNALPAATSRFIASRPAAARWAVGGPAAAADPGAQPVVGRDRYATARMLADRFFPSPTAVAVASGVSFPDGLSGGVHAALRRAPLLLTSPTALPPATTDYVSEHRARARLAMVYGGPSAISDSVIGELRATLDRM